MRCSPGVKNGRALQIIKYMNTSQIELQFFLAAFAEMVILSTLIATLRTRKRQTRKRYRILISLEVFAFWLLGTLLLAIGLALWISTDL